MVNLPQIEADQLIAMQKRRVDDIEYSFPIQGEKIAVPLVSVDQREKFLLDIVSSGRVSFKITYQNRGRQIVVLLRVDLFGRPHRNPDGEEIPCPHLHVYKEGYGDKWAMPLPLDKFTDPENFWEVLMDFMALCNIIAPPHIQRTLPL